MTKKTNAQLQREIDEILASPGSAPGGSRGGEDPAEVDPGLAARRRLRAKLDEASSLKSELPTTRNVPTKVLVPAWGRFSDPQILWTAIANDGRSTGLCRMHDECSTRLRILNAGKKPPKQSPDGQANETEMEFATNWVRKHPELDGGKCLQAFEAAELYGLHSIAWGIASRYIAAGMVPYMKKSDEQKLLNMPVQHMTIAADGHTSVPLPRRKS